MLKNWYRKNGEMCFFLSFSFFISFFLFFDCIYEFQFSTFNFFFFLSFLSFPLWRSAEHWHYKGWHSAELASEEEKVEKGKGRDAREVTKEGLKRKDVSRQGKEGLCSAWQSNIELSPRRRRAFGGVPPPFKAPLLRPRCPPVCKTQLPPVHLSPPPPIFFISTHFSNESFP